MGLDFMRKVMVKLSTMRKEQSNFQQEMYYSTTTENYFLMPVDNNDRFIEKQSQLLKERLNLIEPEQILRKRIIACLPDFVSREKWQAVDCLLNQVKETHHCIVSEVSESLALAIMYRFTQALFLNQKEAPYNVVLVNVRLTHSVVSLVRFEQDLKDRFKFYQEFHKNDKRKLRRLMGLKEYEEKSTEVLLSHSCRDLTLTSDNFEQRLSQLVREALEKLQRDGLSYDSVEVICEEQPDMN